MWNSVECPSRVPEVRPSKWKVPSLRLHRFCSPEWTRLNRVRFHTWRLWQKRPSFIGGGGGAQTGGQVYFNPNPFTAAQANCWGTPSPPIVNKQADGRMTFCLFVWESETDCKRGCGVKNLPYQLNWMKAVAPMQLWKSSESVLLIQINPCHLHADLLGALIYKLCICVMRLSGCGCSVNN